MSSSDYCMDCDCGTLWERQRTGKNLWTNVWMGREGRFFRRVCGWSGIYEVMCCETCEGFLKLFRRKSLQKSMGFWMNWNILNDVRWDMWGFFGNVEKKEESSEEYWFVVGMGYIEWCVVGHVRVFWRCGGKGRVFRKVWYCGWSGKYWVMCGRTCDGFLEMWKKLKILQQSMVLWMEWNILSDVRWDMWGFSGDMEEKEESSEEYGVVDGVEYIECCEAEHVRVFWRCGEGRVSRRV